MREAPSAPTTRSRIRRVAPASAALVLLSLLLALYCRTQRTATARTAPSAASGRTASAGSADSPPAAADGAAPGAGSDVDAAADDSHILAGVDRAYTLLSAHPLRGREDPPDGVALVFPFRFERQWESALPLDPEGNRFIASLEDENMFTGAAARGLYLCDARDNSFEPLLMWDQGFRGQLSGVSPDAGEAAVSFRDRIGGQLALMVIDMDSPDSRTVIENSEGASGRCGWDRSGNLYFARSRDGGPAELCVARNGKTERLVELDYEAFDPWVAPDGDCLYFVSRPPRGAGHSRSTPHRPYEIRRLDLATKQVELLCEGQSPVLLPDGHSLAYVGRSATEPDGARQVMILNLASKSTKCLTNVYADAIIGVTGQGATLLFMSSHQYGSQNLYRVKMDE